MNIYFAGSIRAGRQDASIYFQLITAMQKFSTVLTEHVGSNLSEEGEKDLDITDIYLRDRSWIDEADILVAEVTQPSTGVGYEIGYAESRKKPIYCLFRPNSEKRISGMIEGNASCTVLKYEDPIEVVQRLQALLKIE